MLLLTFALSFQQGPSLETLNSLLKQEDVQGLSRFSAGDGSEFRVLKGGAYAVGEKGWTAKPLSYPGIGEFVVFTTPLTSEDIGELVFERVGAKLRLIDEQEKDGLRIKYQDLKVSFDIPTKYTSITDEVTVQISANDKKFHLMRFSPCYQVSSISGGGKSVSFKQVGGVVMLPKRPVGTEKLVLKYRGLVDLPNYAGSITSSVITLTNDYWYPMANRMPCPYRIAVTPPDSSWTVVGQGKHVGQKDGAELFNMDLPAVYWSLTVLKTKQISEAIDGRTYHMWSPRVSPEQMALQPKLYAPIIKLFNDKFSPFPFDSYGALDSPTYGGGALEAYSYATYGGGLPAEDAHEPSHTWWGGVLPNTYLKSFWNESFANWSSGLYLREVGIGNIEERRKMFPTVSMPQGDYNDAPLLRSGASIGAAAGSLGYGKGSLVLAMLEQLVGTENFLTCVQTWIKNHPVGEPAEWEEFRGVVLQKLPQFHLKDFFDDWFERPGYASFRAEKGNLRDGKATIRLTWNGPKFRMPLDVWLEDTAGKRVCKMVDTLDANAAGEIVVDVPGFKAVKAYVDPYHRALRVGVGPTTESVDDELSKMTVVRDKNQSGYLAQYRGSTGDATSLSGKFLIGHPSTMPALQALCVKAGFQVDGNKLTYDGTTIDLRQGAAIAIVDLGNGKKCGIGLGTTKMRPNLGMASIGLVDDLGRALRGKVKFPTNAVGIPLQ